MQINNSGPSQSWDSDAGVDGYTLTGAARWYVVHTQVQRETSAQIHLRNQAFRTFLPRHEKTVRHARKTYRTLAPLFPRYLFIILDLERDRWHSVNGTIGVDSLLMTCDRPLPAPKGVVEALIAMSSSDPKQIFQPDLAAGQKIRLVAGPFAEQVGVLEHLDDHGRVHILLQVMGALRHVCAPRGDVLPAG
jgi:transcriptional antiterminator RfaH